jgi:hypothetical protein
MRLFLDICTGAGLSAAAGVRPFMPALVAGLFATLNFGVDFDGTDYAFLESFWWLLAMLVLLAFVLVLMRREGAETAERGPIGAALAGVSLAIGALLFAGTLADHGYTAWLGLPAGLACAALGQAAVRSLFTRVRARLDRQAQQALVVFEDGGSLLGSALAVVVPPVSILLLGFLGWLLLGGKRRAGEKYAGLRILR